MPNSRGFYVIPFTVTNPTAVPFLQLATPNNAGLRLIEFMVGQEAGEVAEQGALTIMRRTTASTLPTAASINKLDPTDANSRLATTTTTNAYGIASASGTASDILARPTFDVRVGWTYTPSVEQAAIIMDISQFLTFQFVTAPGANVYSGHAIIEEI